MNALQKGFTPLLAMFIIATIALIGVGVFYRYDKVNLEKNTITPTTGKSSPVNRTLQPSQFQKDTTISPEGSRTVCVNDSQCPLNQKCFECHGLTGDKYVPVKHCYTQIEIKQMIENCGAM